MKITAWLICVSGLILASGCSAGPKNTSQQGRSDLPALFNGKDLKGWCGDPALWSVENGEIVGRTATGIPHNSFLVSAAQYDDFTLTLEVKLVPDEANSGIQFRSEPLTNGEMKGYQADIGRDWWGSIYYESSPRGLLNNGYKGLGEKAVRKNEWNSYKIRAVGNDLRVEINGTVCTHIQDDERPRGHFGLQIHSGGPTEVRFRNLKFEQLP